MVIKRIWPVTAKIYWDPEYDLPLLKPSRELIELTYVVPLTEPGDCRPAFHRDLVKLEEAVRTELGSSRLFNELFKERFTIFNKTPFIDLMYEVVSSGNVWGQLYFDVSSRRWRFRLTASGAYYAVYNNLVDTVVFSGKLSKGLKIRDVSSSSNQLVVVNERGEVKGLATRDKGFLTVVKVFRRAKPFIETAWRKSRLSDVVKHNEEALIKLEERSIKLIKRIYGDLKLPVIVSYSGGKDSLVSLDLVLKSIGGADVLFNDTDLELPETIVNVNEVTERYGLKLVEASAQNAFWRNIDLFGPPGKDYRWCCKLAKLIPIAKVAKQRWCAGALNIVGQRAFESIDRAKSPVVWRNKWIPHLVTATPIQDWNQLAVWLYIYRCGLPYNRLYDEGFERLGCYLCPSSYLAEFIEVERKYPDLWGRWLSKLDEWRIKLNQPPEYVEYGLWRWVTPAMAKYRLVKRLNNVAVNWVEEYKARLMNNGLNLTPIHSEGSNGVLTIVFNTEILGRGVPEVRSFRSNVEKMFSYKFIESGNGVYIVETKDTAVEINGSKMTVKPFVNQDNLEDLVDVLKAIYRARGCSKCGSCVMWCPLRVVSLTRNGPSVESKCVNCRICIDACPIAENIVEKIVVPLITGDPKAWKRKSRRRLNDGYFTLLQLSVLKQCS